MDFNFTPAQMSLKKTAADFAAKEITPYASDMDRNHALRPGLLDKLHKAGFLNLVVPAEYDGPGMDTLSMALAYEELGRGCAAVATSAVVNALAAYPLLLLGTDQQRKKMFAALNGGALAAFAVSEPAAGSDSGGIATSAVLDGDEYVLNGAKCFVANGGNATVFVVLANTRKSAGIRGLSAFLLDRETPGLRPGKEADKMGICATSTCGLVFDNVRVPMARLIGREGDGFRIIMKTLDAARPLVGAVAVGLAQAAFELGVAYAKGRKQFDKPIASFQLVQAMIADMATAIEGARLMVHKACWLKDQGQAYSKEAAMAKCFAADTAMKTATDVVQILGSYGYVRDYPAEKYMRDAKIMQIYEGTNQIQRLVIANNILY